MSFQTERRAHLLTRIRDGFHRRFKITRFDKTLSDRYFPVTHTCFFALELPAYSTHELMKARFRYAIQNCEAIDGDETARAAQAARNDHDWTDEPEEAESSDSEGEAIDGDETARAAEAARNDHDWELEPSDSEGSSSSDSEGSQRGYEF